MLKRPKIKKREDSASAPTTGGGGGGGGGGSAAPPPLPRSSGKGVTTAQLAAALGGGYVSPTGGGSAATGVGVRELGYALSTGGTAEGNRSVASSRHTSYPMTGDLTGLPAKAGTRTGPRTTSYRIPLQRSAHNNVYDTIN